MPMHHPMDRLHQHLDKAVRHGAEVAAAAQRAALAHDVQLQAERASTVNTPLTTEGR